MGLQSGCATVRVTDPPRTATEQFLLSEAVRIAVDQLSSTSLRDRRVFIETAYLGDTPERLFLMGELRAELFVNGLRLVSRREEAEIVLEVRSGGVGIDRTEYLLGIPATFIPTGGVPFTIPELAIVKSTRQHAFAGVAFVSYWANSGEIISSSGPAVGRTYRNDWWFFGYGPNTVGNIPPAEPEP